MYKLGGASVKGLIPNGLRSRSDWLAVLHMANPIGYYPHWVVRNGYGCRSMRPKRPMGALINHDNGLKIKR